VTGLNFGSNAVAVGTDGAGHTRIDIAGTNSDPMSGASGVFIGQFDDMGMTATGTGVVITGDNLADVGNAVAVDAAGNAVAVGNARSDDFSSDGTTLNGAQDAFLLNFTF
jgi:hypothetical protein